MLMCNVFAHTLALFDEVSITCATHWVNRDNERSNGIECILYQNMVTSTTIIETLNVMVTVEPISPYIIDTVQAHHHPHDIQASTL